MKIRIFLLVAVLLTVLTAGTAFADSYLIGNGDTLYAAGEMLKKEDDIVFVAADRLAKMIGAGFTHYRESGIAFLEYRGERYCFMDGIRVYNRSGENVAIASAPKTIGEMVYLPLDAVAKELDLRVSFDANYAIFSFARAEGDTEPLNYKHIPPTVVPSLKKSEFINMARLLYFEARDGSILKKIAVGNVVLNRVLSDRFPNTVDGVIFAAGQFPPAYYESFSTLIPTPKSVQAAIRALSGEMIAKDCLYFNIVPFPGKEADFFKNIEGDYFYY